MPSRKIALSALQQRDRLSGTGRYIAELFDELPDVSPNQEFLLYCKRDQRHNFRENQKNSHVRVLEECPSEPWKRVLWEWRHFTNQLVRDGVDLYHGPANFLPSKKVCPYVLTLHDMVYFTNPKRTFWARAKYWHYSVRRTVTKADAIITISEFSKTEILRYLDVPPEKIRVVLCGVSDDFFATCTDEQKRHVCDRFGLKNPFICFLGRLDMDKNPLGLINAYHGLLERGIKDLDLVFTGTPDYRSEKLVERVKELGLGERVRFLGFVKDEEMIPLLQSASVFCYPSFNEGFGLPALEAMAAGVPVVTSNLSSLPEVVGDAGIQVDPYSTRAITDGLEEALRPDRAQELRQAGLARAKTMTWAIAAQQTAAVYEEVLKGVGR